MRVPYGWIREFVGTGLGVEEAAERLTMAGLEVEALTRHGEDVVLDINVTPNRPDCLSVFGIARELSAITGAALAHAELEPEGGAESDFEIEILDEDLCARYASRIIRGVRVSGSPPWMAERLESCGIRSINNIVDVTNYVLLELGHPLHAFDLATLRGRKIRVGRAGKGMSITTLDGVGRGLGEDALLIWDAERPVAVAGVMGGADTEVAASTADLLIESAWFRPESVRRTSKALGLSTEASYRFERGTDVENLKAALDRAVRLILKVAGGRAEKTIDAYPVKFQPRAISVKYEKVNRVLGTSLDSGQITGILERLGMEVVNRSAGGFDVIQPPHRVDMLKDIDVVEEVARLHGYWNIPTKMPCMEMAPRVAPREETISEVIEVMRKEGFHDAINLSFMNLKYLDALGIPPEDERRRCVEIKNPLRAEDSHLRTTLAPSLMENCIHNLSRGMREVRLFEVSKVFTASEGRLPEESLRLGGVLSVERAPALYRETAPEFFVLKGVVESVLDRLRIEDCTFGRSSEPYLHPGKSADLFISGKKTGHLGALSPEAAERFGFKPENDVHVFELDLDALLGHVPRGVRFRQIPKFPHVERDVALVVEDSMDAADIIKTIKAYPSGYIEDVSVFDIYRGGNIPEGKKSLAFSIRYRSAERTLTNEEVEEVHSGLVGHLIEKTGAEVRGA